MKFLFLMLVGSAAWAAEPSGVVVELEVPVRVAGRAVLRVDGGKGPGGNYQIFCTFNNLGRRVLSLKAGTKLPMMATVEERGVALKGKGLEIVCTEEGAGEDRPIEFMDETALLAFRFVNRAMSGKLYINSSSQAP